MSCSSGFNEVGTSATGIEPEVFAMPSKRPPPSLPGNPRDTGTQHSHSRPEGALGETWLSTEQVAQRLKIPAKTLSTWAAAGRGPRYARMGRYRRYRLSDLVDWEQQRLDEGGGESPETRP